MRKLHKILFSKGGRGLGNFPGVIFPGSKIPGDNFPGGFFPGGIFPGDILPGGIFPRTALKQLKYFEVMLNIFEFSRV